MAGMSSIRVLIVDDDALVRAGLAMMLDGAGEITVVVGRPATATRCPTRTARARVDVVLMDLRMPRVGRARRDPAAARAGPGRRR